MSAYITLATPMLEQDCLLEALEALGFGADKVEVHPSPVPLVGYDNEGRPAAAEIVIRRRFVGHVSNDIGFELTATGFKAHISDYDQGRYGASWLSRLQQGHDAALDRKRARLAEAERQRLEEARLRLIEAQRQAVQAKAKKLGYRVTETRQGETVRLVLVKRVY